MNVLTAGRVVGLSKKCKNIQQARFPDGHPLPLVLVARFSAYLWQSGRDANAVQAVLAPPQILSALYIFVSHRLLPHYRRQPILVDLLEHSGLRVCLSLLRLERNEQEQPATLPAERSNFSMLVHCVPTALVDGLYLLAEMIQRCLHSYW